MIFLTDFADQAVLLPLALVIAPGPGLTCGAAVRLIAAAGTLATITLLKILFGACGPARLGGGGESAMIFGRPG